MLKNKELLEIYGGAGINASLLNSLSRIFDIFIEAGQMLGSSIRNIRNKKLC